MMRSLPSNQQGLSRKPCSGYDILLSSLRVRCLFDLKRLVLGGLASVLVVGLNWRLGIVTIMYAAELEGMMGRVIEQ